MKRHTIQYLMKSRVALLFIIFIFAFILLSYRLIKISVVDDQNYKQVVLAQQVDSLTDTTNQILPKRGTIYDKHGIALAESNTVYNVIFDPAVLKEHKEEIIDNTINLLSETFEGVTKEQLRELMVERSFSNYEIIARKLTYPDIEVIEKALADYTIKGVAFEKQYQREYPYNTMASDVIGFLSTDGRGLWGLEKTYNNYLAGEMGRRFGAIDNENNVNQEDVEAVVGYDVILNIDFTIQGYIEEAIENFYKEEEALSVRVIVMDPQNGQILGMASYPNYNLNEPYNVEGLIDEEEWKALENQEQSDFLNRLWKNSSISESYEPGSTFKPFTFAMALEEYLVDPYEEKFLCIGYKVPYEGENRIYCHKRTGHGMQNLFEALSNSCNVAFMDLGEIIGRDFFYNYQRMFGFGSVTGIDLYGEESFRGNIYSYEELRPVEIQTSAFGQGFALTPMQLISGFSAIVNGGYLYEPQLMDKVVSEDGRLVEENQPVLQRKVISEEVSEITAKALRTVVDEGTGKGAKIEGYSIGGKTGTAEKGDRNIKDYVVSFIGFSPAVAPEVITLVVVDDPVGVNVNSRYAATIFKELMKNVLPYMRVAKIYGEEEAEIEIELNEEEPVVEETEEGSLE